MDGIKISNIEDFDKGGYDSPLDAIYGEIDHLKKNIDDQNVDNQKRIVQSKLIDTTDITLDIRDDVNTMYSKLNCILSNKIYETGLDFGAILNSLIMDTFKKLDKLWDNALYNDEGCDMAEEYFERRDILKEALETQLTGFECAMTLINTSTGLEIGYANAVYAAIMFIFGQIILLSDSCRSYGMIDIQALLDFYYEN